MQLIKVFNNNYRAISIFLFLLLFTGLCFGMVAPVWGEPVVIDFEDLSTGGPGQGGQVEVSGQYEDKGIIFILAGRSGLF